MGEDKRKTEQDGVKEVRRGQIMYLVGHREESELFHNRFIEIELTCHAIHSLKV